MATTREVSSNVANEVARSKDSIIALRREFHEHAELAFEEVQTAEIIVGRLKALGLQVESGIGVTGVLGWLEGAKPGKTLMLRADMDALPMSEPDDRPYRSKNENRNHSCGHDMNMAMVIGAAEVLATHRDQIAGKVAFVFQPADEVRTGAQRMIDDGLLKKVRPDMILSHHSMDGLKTGTVVAQPGALWASSDVQKLLIKGSAGAFPMPETGTDVALIAAQVTTALYAMVHRENPPMEPVVFRVSSIHTERRPGVPEVEAELVLRLGTHDKALQERLRGRIEEVIAAIVGSMGGSYTLEVIESLPPVTNDPTVTQAVINAVKQVGGEENLVQGWRNFFADDLALFMEDTPGCLFLVGSANPDKGITGSQHRPDYDIDEDTLPIGVEVMSLAALELLQ